MDVPRLDVLADNVGSLLKPDACIAVTVMHPSFFAAGAHRTIEFRANQQTGHFERVYSVKIEKYLGTGSSIGRGLQHQPKPQVSLESCGVACFSS